MIKTRDKQCFLLYRFDGLRCVYSFANCLAGHVSYNFNWNKLLYLLEINNQQLNIINTVEYNYCACYIYKI